MGSKRPAGIDALCIALDISRRDFRIARAQVHYVYVEDDRYDPRRNKTRHVCYPRHSSTLYDVQQRIKDKLLAPMPLLPAVRGYLKNSHNIAVAEAACAGDQLGKVDIAKFHPSITTAHVAWALSMHGFSPSWAREIAALVTYLGTVPQGACTSNHIANIVMDALLLRFVKAFADRQGVACCNFGDDIAFIGNNPSTVRQCVRHAKKCFATIGFETNHKCRECEHRGGERVFIGVHTGRSIPDYPRKKYRDLRRELRAYLFAERGRSALPPLTTPCVLNSLRQRIAYVGRINKRKARSLKAIFHRLCAARRTWREGAA